MRAASTIDSNMSGNVYQMLQALFLVKVIAVRVNQVLGVYQSAQLLPDNCKPKIRKCAMCRVPLHSLMSMKKALADYSSSSHCQ